jgi:ABC-type glycerol-3-phosphate transport system substrate-binding protein
MNMDKYINWQTGECRFNDENFIQLLELAGCFPVSPPVTEDYATQLRDGRALIITDTVRGFFDFQVYRAMFQRDVSCIGFPSESGSDNRFMLRKGLSITSKCEHKEAAWEFISFVISEEYQVEGALYELPTNKAAFESYADKAMQSNTYINEEGEVVEYPVGIGSLGDFVVDIYAATKEDVELVRRLIADTKKLAEQDLTVLKIIQEEALGYFNDQCSASDAASIIQSRVSTYINEQR